jgi:uncharacterized protein (DUF1778 family)
MTDSRINMRISKKQLDEIKAAAQLLEKDLTSFMISAALEKAERVIADSNVFRITAVEMLALQRDIELPPESSERLRKLLDLTRSKATAS